jgi:hypothetical protein
LKQVKVFSFQRHKFGMISRLNYFSFVEKINQISPLNGGKTMADDNGSFVVCKFFQCVYLFATRMWHPKRSKVRPSAIRAHRGKKRGQWLFFLPLSDT